MTDTYVADAQGRLKIFKDPDATLDYSFDWTEYLAAMIEDGLPAEPDTISLAVCTVTGSASAVVEQTDRDGNVVTGWVSGGAIGETVKLSCEITTAGGRVEIRSVYLVIKAR